MLLRQGLQWAEACARRNYVAGSDLQAALPLGRRLSRRGYRISLGYWNPVGEPADKVFEAYREALEQVADVGDVRLAVKLPALASDSARFGELLELSRKHRVPIHLDSLRPHDAETMYRLLEGLEAPPEQLGCTLPARWPRSLADARWAADRGLVVRVVKGQWPVAAGDDADLRGRYLAVIDALAGRAARVLVATHDRELAVAALDRLERANTPCELELLHGLPVRRLLPEAMRRWVPVRIYLPYGHAWLPYCLSAMRRNPRVLGWVLRDMLLDVGRLRAVYPPVH